MADVFIVTATSDDDSNGLTLSEAIVDAEFDQNGAIIEFSSSVFTSGNDTYTLTRNLPPIGAIKNVTIDGTTTDGQGITIDAAGHRGLFVSSGNVSIKDLTIANAAALGAAGQSVTAGGGGGGGGGGAGLGGGLFVGAGANVTLGNVAFRNDSATGGAGGYSGLLRGAAGSGGAGGGFNGKAGGFGGDAAGLGNGGSGIFGAGGGGGGGPVYDQVFINNQLFIFGGAGSGGSSAFGGGGGGGGAQPLPAAAADGVIADTGGAGGFGAGSGAAGALVGGGGGGGGLGAGGDIFVQEGGSLTIAGGTLGAGAVSGGAGGGGEASGTNGQGFGGGLFIQGQQVITFDPAAGQMVTIAGVIADQAEGDSSSPSGSLLMKGAGTLVLAADSDAGSSAQGGFTGGIVIKDGTVVLGALGAAGSGAITFQNTAAIDPTIEFTWSNAPNNEIDGFGPGDKIQIDGFLETSLSYTGNQLTVVGTDPTGTTVETVVLTIPGETKADFQVEPFAPGQTFTVIDYAPCYCRGTRIMTKHGQKQVEDLKIGDKLRTASGALRPIKWIGTRSYGARFVAGRKDILPVCIKAGALADNVPARDLRISPNHAMYLSGMLIEAKDLLNGISIVQEQAVDTLEYFHIELDTHDVIIAEGALSESFIDDDSRGMFHNAHEFETLYSQEHPAPASYCAPRLDEGYEVEEVRQRLAARAGLAGSAGTPGLGALHGYVDRIRATAIFGWAQNSDTPEAPVCLDIYTDGKLIGRVLANTYRDDLKRVGLGSGRHAFAFTAPAGVMLDPATIEVRRSLDGARLPLPSDADRTLPRKAS